MNDISSEIHAHLDAKMAESLGSFPGTTPHPALLTTLLTRCTAAYADLWPIDQQWFDFFKCTDLISSRPDILRLLDTARATGKYAQIRRLRM